MALKATVVGVGMVGEQIISILRERSFPMEWPPIVCATRERTEILDGEKFYVKKTDEACFEGRDIVFFAGKEGARGASVQWREKVGKTGAVCIDNGSDFRLDPAIPLVVPEVNPEAVTSKSRFIASPNCSTIQLVMILHPLHQAARIRRVVVSTYQSVSGWGVRAYEELLSQISQALKSLDKVSFDPTVFSRSMAFNCLPHIDKFTPDGYTKEEMKLVLETQKIMGDENINISPTAVRVPVLVGHGESINIETENELSASQAQEVLSAAPGILVMDELNKDNPRHDPLERTYPVPLDIRKSEYQDLVLVGRIREDSTLKNGLNLWCVADNLRKGAALNVVQIGELLIKKGIIRP